MRKLLALSVSMLLSAGPAFGQGAAAFTRIGAAAAVKGAVRAQAPGAVGRVMESGKPLYLNDHVTTDAGGRLQVLLLDETVFTLGPNSDMVLDEFVYDPANDSGKVTARVTKGVFRFVTGKVARRDPSSMKVKLPVGTIGIRGTIAIGEATAESSTAILMGPGANTNTDEAPGSISFESNGETRVMTEPGDGVTCKAGQAPSSVGDLSAKANDIAEKLDTPPDAKAQNSGGGSGGDSSSAGEQSGQQTASAKGDSTAALDDTEAGRGTSQLIQQANQDAASGIANGTALWDQIRSNIQTGQGFFFSGDIAISCSGCASGSSAQGALQLQIDFGARTIGGTGLTNPANSNNTSFIHMHGLALAGMGDTMEQTINSTSFDSLSGLAVLTLRNTASLPGELDLNAFTQTAGGSCTTCFDGSVITLINADGVVAKEAKVDLTWSGTNTSASASSASGQFTAPR